MAGAGGRLLRGLGASWRARAGRGIAGAAAAAGAAGAAPLVLETVSGVDAVGAAEWDACAAGGGPFVRHAFLEALEASGSAVRERGWAPVHALLREDAPGGRLLGCSPLYVKGHSAGEYVFDHGWAEAYPQMCPGRSYYPKLQSCVPFTPVTGPRLLAGAAASPEERARMVGALGQGLVEVGAHLGTSGVHLTFGTGEEWAALRAQGWLGRRGIQYHWENRNYADFNDFLMALKQSKRKNIRQERKRVAAAGVRLERLSGADLTPAVWDRFYEFYLDTVDRKWGRAYLTREFFHRLGEAMGDRVLLVVAREGGEQGDIIAGALNLMDDEAVYGRNWGCARGKDLKGLHFEVCYYQVRTPPPPSALPPSAPPPAPPPPSR